MQPSETAPRTGPFRAALRGQGVPLGVTARDPEEAARRFDVYRNNVAHSLNRALAGRYPVIERLVGAEFFTAMAREFIAAHPPQSPVIAEWGGEFSTFLKGFGPVLHLTYLPDVAQIEWARGLAYHAADALPVDPASLRADAPLALHPSVHLLALSTPAVSIWLANQPGQSGKVAAQGGETAFIYRRPDFEVPVVALAPAEAGLLAALKAGVPLDEAAATLDPTEMLTQLLTHQLIIAKDMP